MIRSVSNFTRLWRIARTLARHDALIPKEFASQMPLSLRITRRVLGFGQVDIKAPPGVRLARALESLGPAHIKLGQILATRPDLIGSDVAAALEQLQDRLPPFPTDQAKKVIESQLDKPLTVLFSRFGEPVAAASIAQVHDTDT